MRSTGPFEEEVSQKRQEDETLLNSVGNDPVEQFDDGGVFPGRRTGLLSDYPDQHDGHGVQEDVEGKMGSNDPDESPLGLLLAVFDHDPLEPAGSEAVAVLGGIDEEDDNCISIDLQTSPLRETRLRNIFLPRLLRCGLPCSLTCDPVVSLPIRLYMFRYGLRPNLHYIGIQDLLIT